MPRTDTSLAFGPLLAQLRRRHGLSQKDLATHLGCKRTYISQLERNLKIPSDSHLNRLVLALTLTQSDTEDLTEAAKIGRGSIDFPLGMPLRVKQQLLRLIQYGDLSSLGSWAALEMELAAVASTIR